MVSKIKKQFLRDVPTMVRINGRKARGDSAEAQTVSAYAALESACARVAQEALPKGHKGERKQANVEQVMALANQNLGIYLYEEVVAMYAKEDPTVAVLQAGHHYIDIQAPEQGGLKVSLVAYFKLHKSDDLDAQPWLLQGTIVVDISKQTVNIEFSKPVPSPSDLQGSIQQLEARAQE
jgi:hypothetical protein